MMPFDQLPVALKGLRMLPASSFVPTSWRVGTKAEGGSIARDSSRGVAARVVPQPDPSPLAGLRGLIRNSSPEVARPTRKELEASALLIRGPGLYSEGQWLYGSSPPC